MLKNYETYINHITEKINGFFENQKEYIFCKKGCSKCCEKGEYPFSYIEFQYLMKGYNELSDEAKEKINLEIKKIKEEKKNFNGEIFMHKCPFLIDGICTVYNYRGIICRSFGLLYTSDKNGKIQMPFCHKIGLNYSNVYDEKLNTLSTEIFLEKGFKVPPKLYNVSYKFLTQDTFAKGFNFEFGDKKPLIEWFN